AWTCGGSVEAHVFRDSITHSFFGVERTTPLFNSEIILETWIDDYQMFCYILFSDSVRKNRGNTTHRRELSVIHLRGIWKTFSLIQRFLCITNILDRLRIRTKNTVWTQYTH
ncbi:hypothetical protein B4U80_04036, partial [Leptotrombidium deliense]